MKLEKKQMFWIISLSILVVLMLNNLGYINLPKFAIADSDFVLERQDTYSPSLDNITVINGTMNLNFLGTSYNINNHGSIYYTSNASSCDVIPSIIYLSIPNTEGTTRICRIKYTLTNNNTEVIAETYSTIYTKEIEEVEVPGPTEYIQNISYVNTTVYQNVTVEKLVPTETKIFGIKISWIAILEGIILGGIIIFLINWGRRK